MKKGHRELLELLYKGFIYFIYARKIVRFSHPTVIQFLFQTGISSTVSLIFALYYCNNAIGYPFTACET